MQNGFKLLIKEKIKDISSEGYVFKHKSGLTLAYIKNKDINRVFSITFKTPPKDNTGVAHILEHCILAGSQKYQYKDPFNELAKSKLYSYLNAITFKDKTMYPIAGYNKEELFDMADVYLDAVFNPLIFERKEVFLQEGWHYNLKCGNVYSYNGIVYNEMKAVYTDTVYLLKRLSYKSLFPDTCYKYDSAGDPSSIIKLNYNDLLVYYKQTYLPQNACIYLYGDLDINKYLNYINSQYLYLLNNNIKKQKEEILQKQPQKPIYTYSKSYSQINKHLCAAFVIDNIKNRHIVHSMFILGYYLLGFESSPLRQSLTKIGEGVLYEFETDLVQPTFFIFLKNTKIDIKKFKDTIMRCIKKILNNNLDLQLLNSCVNKYEFNLRKEDYGYKPKGLAYNINIVSSFMYETINFKELNKLEILNNIKNEKGMLEKILYKYFLNNAHVAYTTLEGSNTDAPFPIYNNVDINEIKDEFNNMKAFQQLSENKYIKNKIPIINISEISKLPIDYISNIENLSELKLIHSPINLNGVICLNFCFNIDTVSKELLPFIGLYTLLIGKLSTKNYSKDLLSKKINEKFGELTCSFKYYYNFKVKESKRFFELKTELLDINLNEAINIVEEMLLNTNFNNHKHIETLVTEHILKMETIYHNEGHELAKDRVRVNFLDNYKIREEVIGLEFYYFLKEINRDFSQKKDYIINNLKLLRNLLFIEDNIMILATAHKDLLPNLKKSLSNFTSILPHKNYKKAFINFKPIKNTAFITKSKTYNNAMGFNFFLKGYKYSGKLQVLTTILNLNYFQNEIRIKGGAYGAFAEVSKEGYIILYSLRDPNLKATLDIFKNISGFLKSFNADEEEMRKYIIATINIYDKPIHMYKLGERSISNFLSGINYETLVKEREEILHTRVEDINTFSKIFIDCHKQNYIATVGNDNLIYKDKKYTITKKLY